MTLPRIPNPFGGTTIPAVEEQVYNDLYFASCVIDVVREDPRMSLQFVEYNYDTKQFAPDRPQQSLEVPNFWAWATVASPNANPTMRQQWLGLGIQLGLLEIALEKATSGLAAVQGALDAAHAALTSAQEKLAADTTDAVEQSILDADSAAIASHQATIDALATPLAIAQGTVAAIKTQLNIV